MHVEVMDSIEEYLSGTLELSKRRAVEGHLAGCASCREEVRAVEDVSAMFASLKSEETWERSPSFFAGVMEQAGRNRRTAPSFAGLFALDLAFGRRLVFACLVTLAVLGSYLVSREADFMDANGVSPEALLAQQESPAFSAGPAQDKMLVTLTAYDLR
jgi:anti-sigma factor RsiW